MARRRGGRVASRGLGFLDGPIVPRRVDVRTAVGRSHPGASRSAGATRGLGPMAPGRALAARARALARACGPRPWPTPGHALAPGHARGGMVDNGRRPRTHVPRQCSGGEHYVELGPVALARPSPVGIHHASRPSILRRSRSIDEGFPPFRLRIKPDRRLPADPSRIVPWCRALTRIGGDEARGPTLVGRAAAREQDLTNRGDVLGFVRSPYEGTRRKAGNWRRRTQRAPGHAGAAGPHEHQGTRGQLREGGGQDRC